MCVNKLWYIPSGSITADGGFASFWLGLTGASMIFPPFKDNLNNQLSTQRLYAVQLQLQFSQQHSLAFLSKNSWHVKKKPLAAENSCG
jgi:hypothetical protein